MSDPPRFRAKPEDFVVEEVPAYAASGEGEHVFVLVEKRLRTTEQVAADLARAAGVGAQEVGYAGRKDRVAVARQWISVPGWTPEAALALGELRGARVLEATRHPHKLRTGHLRGNRFTLVVRGVSDALADAARERLDEMVATGMPNRFGPQRFGRGGENVERGIAILGSRRPPRDRRAARFLVSAVQAAVFDRALQERSLPLDAVERGDVARVEASGGLFVVEDPAVEGARAAAFEISATGPIFGTKVIAPTGAVAEREAAAHAAIGVPPPGELRAPRGIRLRGARRPLRVRPADAALEVEADRATVRCMLPAGSYATVLLEALFGPLAEGEPD